MVPHGDVADCSTPLQCGVNAITVSGSAVAAAAGVGVGVVGPDGDADELSPIERWKRCNLKQRQFVCQRYKLPRHVTVSLHMFG